MSKKKKFYVVWKGNKTGIFESWKDCKAAIQSFKGAQYKSFPTFIEAKKAFNGAYADFITSKKDKNKPSPLQQKKVAEEVNFNSIAVDAASSGNPGKVEYRGVDTQTKKQLFHQGPFAQGTNNIGEFLALVHGLALLNNQKSDKVIYSDSKIAMSWVRKKNCNTKLPRSKKNADIFALVDRAEAWLNTNRVATKILKWNTKEWGEIPADFGRK